MQEQLPRHEEYEAIALNSYYLRFFEISHSGHFRLFNRHSLPILKQGCHLIGRDRPAE